MSSAAFALLEFYFEIGLCGVIALVAYWVALYGD